MKILAISGSPRKNGNTGIMLKSALEIIETHGIETEYITLADKSILTCTACGGCKKKSKCVLKDDFNDIFEKMVAADGIILGSPVYYSSATGEMTALLDRAGYVAGMNGNLLSRKVGGALIVGRHAGQNFTLAQLLMWFMINDMIVPGSSYWTVAFGRDPGDVCEDSEGMKTVHDFAENLAWLCKKINS